MNKTMIDNESSPGPADDYARQVAVLRDAEANYRSLFQALDTGFCIVEMKFDDDNRAIDYQLVEINPAFERQTGLHGAAGRWVSDIAPDLERHWFDIYGRVALTGEAIRFENFAESFGRWYDVHAFRTGDVQQRRVAILFTDITARKDGEVRLRSLNETLESQVLERTAERDRMWMNSPDLMLVIDFEGVFRRVNPAWTRLLGYLPEELIGHHVSEFVVAEDHALTTDAYETAAQGGSPKVENRYRHKNGSLKHISWVAAPADGLTYATGRDVTGEKEQAAALAQAQESLRQAQKMEAVGQLTGGIAHDFNNMLAVVIGSLDLLKRRQPDADANAKRYMQAATDAARKAAVLTQRLLAFSRQQPLRPEPTNINQLVSGMSELIMGSIASDVRLETVLAGGLWHADIDRNQLENVLLNLAVNARDAMPGGGRLTFETQNAHLDERYVADHPGLAPGQYVLVAVTDTGSGMPADVIAKAFDPFFTTKAPGKGTGLGLSQVYGFVKQSGGHVKIYSELGQGTTIKVYLPRLTDAGETALQPVKDADLPAGDEHEVILVVEDEAAVRQFSAEALAVLGYRVLEADGAASALKLLAEHPDIQLLFTDVVMPDVSGRELADEARRLYPKLKVLFTTGYSRNAVVHNGILDPGVELIGKPFTVEDLAAKVRAVLDKPD